MKFALLLVVVAFAASQAQPQTTYGVLGDIKDTVGKILDRETAIQVKIQEMVAQVQGVIQDTTDWYNDLKESTSPQRPAEYYLEQLVQKLVTEITKIVDVVFSEISRVFEMVVDKVDQFLTGVFGENKIREALYNFLDDALGGYIETVINALRKALEVLNFIDTNDWGATVNKIMDSIQDHLNTKLDQLKNILKEKLLKQKPSPVSRNSQPSTRGLLENIENTIQGFMEKALAIQDKIQEMVAQVQAVIEDTKQWYEDLKESTHPQQPAEYYLEQLVNRLLEQLNSIVDTIFEQISNVFEAMLDKLDQFLTGIFGESTIREALAEYLEELLGSYVEMVISALQKAMEVIDFVDTTDWGEVTNKIIESLSERLSLKMEELINKMKDKLLKRPPTAVTFGFFDDLYRDVYDKVAGMLDETVSKIGEKLNDKVQDKLTELPSKIADKVKDLIQSRANTAVTYGFFDDLFTDVYDKVSGALDETLSKVGDKISNKFNEVLTELPNKITNTVMDLLDQAQDKIGNKVKGLIQKRSNIPVTYGFFDDLYRDVYDKVAGMLDETVSKIGEKLNDKVQDKLTEMPSKIADKVKDLIESRANSAVTYGFFDDLFRDVYDKVSAVLDETLSKIGEKISNKFNELLSELPDKITNKVMDLLGKAQEKIVKDVIQNRSGSPVTYGFFGDLADSIKSLVDTVVQKIAWAKNKLQELVSSITGMIQEAKDWRENLKAETAPDQPMEHYAKQLQKKITDAVTGFIDMVFDEVVSVVRYVIDALDSLFGGSFGRIKDKILQFLDNLLGGFVEDVMTFIRKVLDFLNNIEGYDWSGFIDHLIDQVKSKIDDKLSEIRQEIRDKIGRS